MSEHARRPRRIAQLRTRLFRQPTTDGVDLTRPGLFQLGGSCLAAVGAIYLVITGLSIALGPAPSSSDEYLRTLGNQPTLARIDFILFSVSDLLLVPAAFGLYKALKGTSRRLMLAAGTFIAAFVVLDLGITELNSLVLVQLAQDYLAATSEAQRAAILVSADGARSALPLATSLSYLVSSIGFLFVAIATFRALFRRAIGVIGILGSIYGILAGFYVMVPPMTAFLLPSLVTVGLWCIAVGIRLFRLGRIPKGTKRLTMQPGAMPPAVAAAP